MGWQDLLEETDDRLVIPWLGGRKVYRDSRTWRVPGRLPREFGWYLWDVSGRTANLVKPAEVDVSYGEGKHEAAGYVVGDRFIPEKARVDPDPDKIIEQTVPVYLVERGLDRFVPVRVVFNAEGRAIFQQVTLPLGPEEQVRQAFIERKESIQDIKGVAPALDLAFRFATEQRRLFEERRAELERVRLEEERRAQALKSLGTGVGRRAVAAHDFETAAKAALAVSGAALLDARPGYGGREMVVQYLFENRRLECVVDRETLRVTDSGICLTSHDTGEKGDTYFTLESLPAVVRQAIREGKLVVYRHIDDDEGEDD